MPLIPMESAVFCVGVTEMSQACPLDVTDGGYTRNIKENDNHNQYQITQKAQQATINHCIRVTAATFHERRKPDEEDTTKKE